MGVKIESERKEEVEVRLAEWEEGTGQTNVAAMFFPYIYYRFVYCGWNSLFMCRVSNCSWNDDGENTLSSKENVF